MRVCSFLTLLIVYGSAALLPLSALGQSNETRAFVRKIVNNELAADAADHSRWMFQDTNKSDGNTTAKLVIQTPDGDLGKTISINGQPLNDQQKSADAQKMHQFVTDSALRQRKKRDAQQDDQRATNMTKMLPDAFLWTKVSQNGPETTLTFKPDPNFTPPTREARVFAAMAGTMVVNTEQNRIKSLKGTLSQNVDFGYGILGRLYKGGTFHIERQEIGPKIWQITSTHVHIQGHALIFKSISEQEDDETSHFKPAPQVSLEQAEKLLNDGTVAREIGLSHGQ